MNRLCGAILILSAVSLCGCASSDLQRADAPSPAGATFRSVGGSGLHVTQWRVADRPVVIAEALMRHAEEQAVDDASRARFERNGFRLIRIPIEAVEELKLAIGPAMLDLSAWHGQAYDWRELITRPIEPSGRAIAVDGRVRRIEGGVLRLMMRGWTIQMEDGFYLLLELLPEHDQSQTTRLKDVIGRRAFHGERFTSMAAELLMEPGYAYVLTCESPQVQWNAGDPNADESRTASAASDDASSMPAGGFESITFIGPQASAPLTVGEVLLGGEAAPSSRTLLLFVPRIPDVLFPAGAAPTSGEPGDGGQP